MRYNKNVIAVCRKFTPGGDNIFGAIRHKNSAVPAV